MQDITMQDINCNSHYLSKQQESHLQSCDPVTSHVCHPGQQMDKWVKHIRPYVILLLKSGKYDSNMSEHIILQVMNASESHNEEWKLIQYHLKDKLLLTCSTFRQLSYIVEKANLSPIKSLIPSNLIINIYWTPMTGLQSQISKASLGFHPLTSNLLQQIMLLRLLLHSYLQLHVVPRYVLQSSFKNSVSFSNSCRPPSLKEMAPTPDSCSIDQQ